MALHPIVARSARGELPPWAAVGEARRRHVERVAALLDGWAAAAGLSPDERTRWVAAGYLHDAVKEKPEAELRALLAGEAAALPPPLLHGPAAAELLRRDGVDDAELLTAIAWHTLGHPDFGRLGCALYAADFLEPGRDLKNGWRAELRARLPAELAAVVREILRARIVHLLDHGRPVRPETMGFWNRLAEGEAWVATSAS